MAAVSVALVIGILTGVLLRPFLDAYLAWKTARFYANLTDHHEVAFDAALFRESLP